MQENPVINRQVLRTRHGRITIIDDQNIQLVDTTKFLGVIIDSQLRWKFHIQHVASQLSKCTGYSL